MVTPKIIRSVRKSISLQVNSKGELIVKAPHFVPEKFISDFIKQKQDWIEQSIEKVNSKKSPVRSYQEGEEFLYLGQSYKLHFGNFTKITAEDGQLNVPTIMQFRIQKELNNWYINQANKIITEQTEYFSQKMGVKYKGLRFSDTSSKWGSCFPDNSLQFNWRLIMAPLMVLNYVVIHELAHTIEKNHGVKFWGRVSNMTPAYKQHSKWLNKNKHLLFI